MSHARHAAADSATKRQHALEVEVGSRIAVVGTSGSGKTHVARALATRLGLPYVANDSLIWRPNWVPTPRAERLEFFREALAGDAWTIDGNVGGATSAEDRHILERMDTLVWLDLPRWRVLRQVLTRTLRRVVTRQELDQGNRESFRVSFLSRDSIVYWSMKTYRRRRRQYLALMADPAFANVRRVRLRSRREIDRFIESARLIADPAAG